MALTPKQEDKKPSANSTKTAPGVPFKPGQSGNPNGRPKEPKEFKELAKARSLDALKVVIDIMNNYEAKHSDRIKAAEMIIDRAYGKAIQATEISGPEGAPIEIATPEERRQRIESLLQKRLTSN